MPSSSADLKRLFGELLREAFYASMERGYLGEPIGGGDFKFNSDTKRGRFRVRLMKNDQIYSIVDAVNSRVPRDPRIRVLVDKNADGEYEVFGPDPRWIVENLDRLPGVGVGPHSHRLGFGLVDMVESARFEPGLVVWHSASLFVRVLPFFHRYEGADQYLPETQVSVASAVPVTTGTWAWAKVCYDPETLDFTVIAGPEEASKDALTEASLAAIAAPDVISLAGVKLKAGQTQIVDGADFLDCRAFFSSGDGSSAIEALDLDDLGGRLPARFGEALLVYDGPVPYLYLSNETVDAWLKFALIDVTSGEPTNDHVLTWDTTPHMAVFKEIPASPVPGLLDLSDVDADPAPTDGQVLTWDDGEGMFVFTTPGGGGGAGLSCARVQKLVDEASDSSGTWQIPWQATNYDTIGGFALVGTSPYLFTAPADGVYQHTLMIACCNDVSGLAIQANIQCRINGSPITNMSVWGDSTTKPLVITTPLTSADTVDWIVETDGIRVIGDASLLRTYWEVIRLS